MSGKRKRIFLTGAGGNMGGAALQELLSPERNQDHEIVILDLPTKSNIRKLKRYADTPGLDIVWGDLTRYDDVKKCVSGADVVLHAAAIIPPAADHDPDLAWKVNVGSARNIIRAIRGEPNPDAVRLVTVGTVAATGDRLPPIHVGRTGDPLAPSVFDMYARSKIEAERLVAESGLRHWASLRQTFITTPTIRPNPIIFHQPLNTCLEICTLKNAGLALANAAGDEIPDEFWRRFYNVGGGPRSRTTYLEYLKKMMSLSGISELAQVFERRWFVLRNFHCHWFEDSNLLAEYLHHQVEGLEDGIRNMANVIPQMLSRLAKLVPSYLKRHLFTPLARRYPDSPLYWLDNDNSLRISAFYGSRKAFESIPDWGVDMPEEPSWFRYTRLDHGYDEGKPSVELDLGDMQHAAVFRGGRCLSRQMVTGDLHTALQWQCAFGHTFDASPNTVLQGGHWCPECLPPAWNHAEEARRNPFLAQVWYTNHAREESHYYPRECTYDLRQAAAASK